MERRCEYTIGSFLRLLSTQSDSMSSTDCGVACQSSSTIPLDHHGRLGPHRAAPDVGKSRQRRPSGAWSDRWPVETDNLSGSSTRAHRPRHGHPGAQKSPAHVPRGYPSRFGDGKVLGWYLVRLCVQMCPSRGARKPRLSADPLSSSHVVLWVPLACSDLPIRVPYVPGALAIAGCSKFGQKGRLFTPEAFK